MLTTNRVLRKICTSILTRNKKGESFTEVLVASLIIALAVTMLASMVAASFRMIRRAIQWNDCYYAASNLLETRDKNLPLVSGRVSGSLSSEQTGKTVTISFPTDDGHLPQPADKYISLSSDGVWGSNKWSFITIPVVQYKSEATSRPDGIKVILNGYKENST